MLAKQEKDYAMADVLRDQLIWLWWEVKDVAGGYELIQK
jgi:cysteinyl-tRNA synthetase